MKVTEIELTKQIIQKTGFNPTAILKGSQDYNFGQYKQSNTKQANKTSVVYKGFYSGKPAILKVFITKTFNKARYFRNLYVFNKLTKQYPLWQNITPALYLTGTKPLAFYINEAIPGNPLGDWYHLNTNNEDVILKTIKTIIEIDKTTHLPKHHYFSLMNKPDFFSRKIGSIAKTLNYLDNPKQTWSNFLSLTKKASNLWSISKDSFIINDANPANFLINQQKLKVIDFDMISFGKLEYDLSFLYFASINTPSEKYVQKQIKAFLKNSGKLFLFNYFTAYQILKHGCGLIKYDDKQKFAALTRKFNKLLEELG